jgi:hypothetical protein
MNQQALNKKQKQQRASAIDLDALYQAILEDKVEAVR